MISSCAALFIPDFAEKRNETGEMTTVSSDVAGDEKKIDDAALDFSNPRPLGKRQSQSFEKNVVSAARELDQALEEAFERVSSANSFMCTSLNDLNCLADLSWPMEEKQPKKHSTRTPTFEVDYNGADNKILETSQHGKKVVSVVPTKQKSGQKPGPKSVKSLRTLFSGSKKLSNKASKKDDEKDPTKVPETIAIKKGYRRTWFGRKVKVPDKEQPKKSQKAHSLRFNPKAKARGVRRSMSDKSRYVHDKEATVQDGRQTVHTIQMHRIPTGTLTEV